MAQVLRTLTFKQVLDALKRQVLVGRTYLDIAKGLSGTDPFTLESLRLKREAEQYLFENSRDLSLVCESARMDNA